SKTTPQEISTHFHNRQKKDFAGLGIEFDVFGGTHQPGYRETHERFSQEFFKRAFEKGCFTKRTSKQLFDPEANRFLPDRYVKGICHHCNDHETFGDQCERTGQIIDPLLLENPVSAITGKPAEVRETTHWYLRLNDFERPLKEWLESKQGRWRPNVLNFALGQIKQGLPERAMTRDIAWGIPVPLDDPDASGKVLFVWFDAPIGYVSFTAQMCEDNGEGSQAYKKWWCDPDCGIVHFIGEDNTVFHALIWPAMLMADARHQLPWAVVANNFVNIGSGKVSKSQTSADSPVWIEEYLKRFDPDALRYYLTAIAPETARTTFDPADFVARNNNELVAAFGNFVNRTLKFAAQYLDGKVPDAASLADADRAHAGRGAEALTKVGVLIEQHRFKAALEELMAYARACNEHFSVREPWRTRKVDPVDCAAAIASCIHAIAFLRVMAWPFMPGASRKIAIMLGLDDSPPDWQSPQPLVGGRALGTPEILFNKLESDCMS
ncbi:MAG: methionine--tRNA ligase, partial [Planctomycetes bacterium]|nr:methionine--tRNA ligase [Planctomycetota bacterium]